MSETRATESQPVPELLVERLAAGDLPPDQAADVQRRLAGEPDGEARLAAIARENVAILEHYPPAGQVSEITRRAAAEQRAEVARRRRWVLHLAPALVAAAAALLIFVVLTGGEVSRMPVGGGGIRLKGDPLLWVYRFQPRGAPERLSPGAEVAAGDRLQIRYTAGVARHGVILSLDGRGVATLHFPATPGRSTELQLDGAHLLDHSYELDDAPGFERFFFVTAKQRINVKRVLRAARALGGRSSARLSLGDGLKVKQLLLPKQPRLAPQEVPR